MHQVYQSLVCSRATQMVGAARALTAVSHNGLKGELREIIVRDLLNPLLPPEYVVGTGQIISPWGQESGQTDIVVYDRRVLPPILFDRIQGIFPIEAVIATIEVKSRLNATELEKAHDAADKVSGFFHAPPVGKPVRSPGQKIEHVIPLVLAFDTDLSTGGLTEIERYKPKHGAADPALRGICVVGRGYWYFADGGWHDGKCNCVEGEVVGFAATVVNACQRIARTRLQPDMRDYLDKDMPPLP